MIEAETLKLLKAGHRLTVIYNGMLYRCTNSSSASYKRYGAVGITVCEEWLSNLDSFLVWAINNGYDENLTLDRKDGTKNYTPDNCRWVTVSTQNSNIRFNSRNTSGYKGVSYRPKRDKWEAQIKVDKKLIYLGVFKTAIEAATAYDSYIEENALPHPTNKQVGNY